MGEYGVHLSATYLGYISRLYISAISRVSIAVRRRRTGQVSISAIYLGDISRLYLGYISDEHRRIDAPSYSLPTQARRRRQTRSGNWRHRAVRDCAFVRGELSYIRSQYSSRLFLFGY